MVDLHGAKTDGCDLIMGDQTVNGQGVRSGSGSGHFVVVEKAADHDGPAGADGFMVGVGVEEDQGGPGFAYGWVMKLVRRKASHGLRPQVIILARAMTCHWLTRP